MLSILRAVFGLGTPRALAALPDVPVRPHGFDAMESVDLPLVVGGAAITLHVRVTGRGPPLVLVHGMMTSAYSFRYVVDALGAHFRVYVPDLPGAGRTVAPPTTDMRPAAVADLLAAMIDTLGLDRPYVVANSMGGYLGVWLALLHPNTVGRLLVMHAPGFPDLRLRALRVATRLPGAAAIFRWLVTRSPEEFVRRNVHYHDDSVKSREETREYARIFFDPTQTALFWKVLTETLDTRDMAEMARRLSAAKLPMPVHLLWARRDVMVPPWTGDAYAAALGVPVVRLDDTSHFMQVDRPDETIRQILAFAATAVAPGHPSPSVP